MIYLKKFFFLVVFFLSHNILYANEIAFIDVEKIINESKAGIFINEQIKNEQDKNFEEFKKEESLLKKEENDILSKKNILAQDEFEKKIRSFQRKVNTYNKERKKKVNLLNRKSILIRSNLVKEITPIISKYAKENSFSAVIPKKNIIVGKTELDITKNIIEIMDKVITKVEVN